MAKDEALAPGIALIPARQGSKGIKDKCIRPIRGTPLLTRAIQTALKAGSVASVWVSTDSEKYGQIAREAGANVPFLRPPELATDHASSVDVLLHFLTWYEKSFTQLPEFVLLLQLTAPFVTAADIDAAFSLFTPEVEAVCSVCVAEHKPAWLRTLSGDGFLRPLAGTPENSHIPRQLMPEVYRINGGIYWIRTRTFLQGKNFLPPHTRPYIMPTERSIDIDSPFDLELARWLAGKYATNS